MSMSMSMSARAYMYAVVHACTCVERVWVQWVQAQCHTPLTSQRGQGLPQQEQHDQDEGGHERHDRADGKHHF